ncbi:MAG: biotin-dependent carboxyltransferase family protein [Lautropia sp.]
MTITVLKPGAYSSFQDLGRTGAQHLGFPVSGAMDVWSHRIANRVLGNPDTFATLELTLSGPALRFDTDATVAWCGADLSPTLVDATAHGAAPAGGRAVPAAEAVAVRAGETLRFGRRIAGVRAYLAVRGGFALTPFLGSCSTWARAGIGGHEGRPLAKGDTLALARVDADRDPAPGAGAGERAGAALADIDNDRIGAPIRVVAGRDWARFDDAAHRALTSAPYRVGAQSDRMGYRLEGRALERVVAGDLLSEAVAFGTMQVPPDGQPIILMAERQTTGGYPKIAQVASVDLPRLAQYAPGEVLRFQLITLGDAQALLIARLRELDRRLPPAPGATPATTPPRRPRRPR